MIRGWGISSDGQGGLTRPEVEGQLLALHRAYKRAGFGIETVSYFEGHGTGTSVGDATELRALGRARRESEVDAPPAAIGSIKANVGHTKAAAGVAGLIKAALALDAQIVPPTTGCEEPHPELTGDRPPSASSSRVSFGLLTAHFEPVSARWASEASTPTSCLSRSLTGAHDRQFSRAYPPFLCPGRRADPSGRSRR